MKTLTHSIVVLLFLFCFTNLLAQQPSDDEVVVITKLQLAFPEDGSNAEFDSLNQLYTDKVIKKNEHILWHRNVRHLWGSDSRDYLVIYGLKSFEDVNKANERNNELFEEAWATEEAREVYNNAMNKYFTTVHSDEIYTDIKSGRK